MFNYKWNDRETRELNHGAKGIEHEMIQINDAWCAERPSGKGWI